MQWALERVENTQTVKFMQKIVFSTKVLLLGIVQICLVVSFDSLFLSRYEKKQENII